MKNNLKKIREKKGFTQKEISKKLGIGERHYQNIEAGTSDGSMGVWIKLSKILNKKIDELIK